MYMFNVLYIHMYMFNVLYIHTDVNTCSQSRDNWVLIESVKTTSNVKWEYQGTLQKNIYLRCETKVNKNKVLSYGETLRCKYICIYKHS